MYLIPNDSLKFEFWDYIMVSNLKKIQAIGKINVTSLKNYEFIWWKKVFEEICGKIVYNNLLLLDTDV